MPQLCSGLCIGPRQATSDPYHPSHTQTGWRSASSTRFPRLVRTSVQYSACGTTAQACDRPSGSGVDKLLGVAGLHSARHSVVNGQCRNVALQEAYTSSASPAHEQGPPSSASNTQSRIWNGSTVGANGTRSTDANSHPVYLQKRILLRAKRAKLSGQLPKALTILYEGLNSYPCNKHFLVAAAGVEGKLGNTAKALELLHDALAADPNSVHVLAAAATAHARSGQHDVARDLFSRAHVIQPDNAVMLQSWAVMEVNAKQYDAARMLFQQAAAADSSHVPTYSAWGRLEAELGQLKQARALFQKGYSVGPDHAPNLHVRSDSHSMAGRL